MFCVASTAYGARYYAAWTCRFISVDPLAADYPFYTPYNYAGNKPINKIDIDGMQEEGAEPAPSSPPAEVIQGVARNIVRSARFDAPMKTYYKEKRGIDLNLGEKNTGKGTGYGYIKYFGNKKPSKMIRDIQKKVSDGEIGIDCQFTSLLIYLSTVLEMLGKKKFDKMFLRTEQERNHSVDGYKYAMDATLFGLRRDQNDLTVRKSYEKFKFSQQQDGIDAANAAEVGSIVTLSALNPGLVGKHHQNEVMIKVGTDDYVAFNYTEGENAKFYSLSEILEETKRAGSKFRVQSVIQMEYGN